MKQRIDWKRWILSGHPLYERYQTMQRYRREAENEQRMVKSFKQYENAVQRMEDEQANTALGSGGIATAQDAQNLDMFNPNGLYIAHLDDEPIFYGGDKHMLSYGKAGSGKGRDIILTNLAHIKDESIIVMDVKNGENAYASASHRTKNLGQDCIALDPAGLLGSEDYSFNFNPCQMILDAAQRGEVIDGQERQFAEILIPMSPEQANHSNAWVQHNSRDIIAGYVKYLAYYQPEDCNPSGLYKLAYGDREDVGAIYDKMTNCADVSISGIGKRYGGIFEIPKQYEAYNTELTNALAPFAPGSIFGKATSSSDFDPGDLKNKPSTVYIMLPTSQLEAGKKWMVLITSMMIERIAETTGPVRTTILADELANLPYMTIIPKTLKLYRELGVRLWGFCQGRNSLRAVGYSKEVINEFEDQSGVFQMWEIEEPTLIKDIQESWGGKKSVINTTAQHGGGGGFNASISRQEVVRPVWQPEDIRSVGHGEQILKISGCFKLFRAQRVPWFEIDGIKDVLRDVRDIAQGRVQWSAKRQIRDIPIEAPPPPPPPEEEPDQNEIDLWAAVEEEKQEDLERIARLKNRVQDLEQQADVDSRLIKSLLRAMKSEE